MLKKYFMLALTSCLLISCVSPYQPSGLGGGYTDMALNEDTYFVTFRGNGNTSAETVQNYVLRRSAELTISKGYKYFIILNGGTDVNTQLVQTPTTVQTQSFGSVQGSGYSYGNNFNYSGYGNSNSSTTINPGTQYEVDRYKSGATIKMLYNNKNYPQAFDAAIILSNYPKQ